VVNDFPTADIDFSLRKLRVALIKEEAGEYTNAVMSGDIVDISDALMDLLYVTYGAIVVHGLQGKAVELFDEVQRSNMSKLDAEGNPVYREDGKVLKSDLFSPSDLKSILTE